MATLVEPRLYETVATKKNTVSELLQFCTHQTKIWIRWMNAYLKKEALSRGECLYHPSSQKTTYTEMPIPIFQAIECQTTCQFVLYEKLGRAFLAHCDLSGSLWRERTIWQSQARETVLLGKPEVRLQCKHQFACQGLEAGRKPILQKPFHVKFKSEQK